MRRIIHLFSTCTILAFILISQSGCVDEVKQAHTRINNAINTIIISQLDNPKIYAPWAEFMSGDSFVKEGIHVALDFKYILQEAKVEKEDFKRADADAEQHFNKLYQGLAVLFERTDHLVIEETNLDYLLDYGNFDLPTRLKDNKEIPIEISRFLKKPSKLLDLITHYGMLSVTSDFLYGRPGFGNNGFSRLEEGLKLVFSFKEDKNLDYSYINFVVRDKNNEIKDAQNPGKSAVITIPLSSKILKDNDSIKYNAVSFVDLNGTSHGVISRSFVADDSLYIYVNRTGSYRLTSTPNGATKNITDFLQDRRISFKPTDNKRKGEYVVTEIDNQLVVTRGGFYSALMQIHWAEQLHFNRPITPFVDVITGGDLEHFIHIGQNLEVQLGPHRTYVLNGFPDRLFRPDEPLSRKDMYIMLAGNIEYFELEVDGLMPAQTDAIGMPDYIDFYWQPHINYLIEKGFVPYARTHDGKASLNPYGYIPVQEAEEIIFMLITGNHFNKK